MTERGLPTEGAPACPFVAFEDDRDGRSTAPDHRHRCFAEPRPAPRALAHQEAYCLSSAFPVCPTFQDWARREAAAARPSAPLASAAREEPPQSRAIPPLEREPRRIPGTETPPPIPPRRTPHRDWAAPPPWADGTEEGDDGPGAAAAAAGAAGAGALWGPAVDAPIVAPREAGERRGEARGLAGSAAHRLAGPDPDEPEPATPERHDRYARPDRQVRPDHAELAEIADRGDRVAHPDDLDEAWAPGAGAHVAGSASARHASATPPDDARYAPPSRRAPGGSRPEGRRRGQPQVAARDQVRRPPQQDAQELFGPAWERPRRYEAYPSLRTRMGIAGIGGVPRVALLTLLLVAAALFLFLFGPSLLGLVKDDGGVTASPTPTASVEPSVSAEPTEPPAPTPQVYVVAKNDTMSKIAQKFGLTLEELMAANPQIKNPNRIKIGDEITIPVPVEDGGFPEGGESASP